MTLLPVWFLLLIKQNKTKKECLDRKKSGQSGHERLKKNHSFCSPILARKVRQNILQDTGKGSVERTAGTLFISHQRQQMQHTKVTLHSLHSGVTL